MKVEGEQSGTECLLGEDPQEKRQAGEREEQGPQTEGKLSQGLGTDPLSCWAEISLPARKLVAWVAQSDRPLGGGCSLKTGSLEPGQLCWRKSVPPGSWGGGREAQGQQEPEAPQLGFKEHR